MAYPDAMTASTESSFEDMDDLYELLDDEPQPPRQMGKTAKGNAVALRRTPKQVKASAEAAEAERVKAETEASRLREKAAAQRLAQVVNLHIGGMSLAEIGAEIGATADEVDQMIAQDAARYVRSEPMLRKYVRNWVSDRYAKMIDVDMPFALDPTHEERLENQDRAIKLLDKMAKLHGAEAPVQSELKVEQAPEALDRIVAVLAKEGGLGTYDMNVFDLDPEDVEEVVDDAQQALTVSGNDIEEAEDNGTWT